MDSKLTTLRRAVVTASLDLAAVEFRPHSDDQIMVAADKLETALQNFVSSQIMKLTGKDPRLHDPICVLPTECSCGGLEDSGEEFRATVEDSDGD